jgi:hypothetical protein
MFEYGTKSDAEGRQAFGASLRRGFALLGIVAATLCLLSGRTVLGLATLVQGLGLVLLELSVVLKKKNPLISPGELHR